MIYLAIDIGASSGRHILGRVEEGQIKLKEIHRFENRLEEKNGHLCWNLERLFDEILTGMKKCSEIGEVPHSIGIDCFGVDFVLLDEENKPLGDPVAYRDDRTKGMIKEIEKLVGSKELYKKTGIQNQVFNTIYQLAALKKSQPELIKKAKRFLMLPDYFHYLLTGKFSNEYTDASTTQLLNATTREFDSELLSLLGLPQEVFGKVSMPGTLLGELSPEIAKAVGFKAQVILPATHDTASAVMAMPSEEDGIYLSSGTWSLMGVLSQNPNCSEQSKQFGFTNEGGYQGSIRLLKNIMGLWIIQSVKRELTESMNFSQMEALVEESTYSYAINVNDPNFFSPKNMTEAIHMHLKEAGAPSPANLGDLLRSVYLGLAKSYGETVKELEELTGKTYPNIYIIGGGSKDGYLNRLTAETTGKAVYAGPSEATAIGNLLVQMIKQGEFSDLSKAKESVAKSFDVKEYRV